MSDESLQKQQRTIDDVKYRTEKLVEAKRQREEDGESLRRQREEEDKLLIKLGEEVVKERSDFVTLLKDHKESRNNMILLLGPPGVGKSAFINSWGASMYNKWSQVAKQGTFHPDVRPNVTVRQTDYLHSKKLASGVPGCLALTHQADPKLAFQKEQLPSFRDFPGFADMQSKSERTIVRLLIKNAMPSDTTRAQLDELVRTSDLGSLEQLLPEKLQELSTHRVFVFWDANTPVPTNFLNNVVQVTSPTGEEESGICFHQEIRLFGIITKTDLVNKESKEYKDNKQLFASYLGLEDNFVFEITNYSPATTPTFENDPRIDLNFLTMMKEVMEPANAPSLVQDVVRGEERGRNVPRPRPGARGGPDQSKILNTLFLFAPIMAYIYWNYTQDAPPPVNLAVAVCMFFVVYWIVHRIMGIAN